ncbi:MAG: Eco57I restriction-modification methylase domain-containing protein [Chloroflexi bacterium]|nr:Eco57I restriction-modification methylase domain-containing protein [Chloroflexota bacterium]
MKKPEAEKLINDTITNPYREEQFRLFARNLFHDLEELSEKPRTDQYLPEAFREGIVSSKRLAKFSDPEGRELDLLAVKLPSSRTLENARTMQRNFIARYLNGGQGGNLKDAALVAFYSDDSEDWRFSLVRMNYLLDEEKHKVPKELTPARRSSFLVGRSEKTHTARCQLLPLLQAQKEITLAELEAAFNIETVTKEFFEQYKGLYLRLKEAIDQHLIKDAITRLEFEVKGVKTPDFAKRLLGQIVFLYFLQRKGWLGVTKGKAWGTGSKDFLQQLYRKNSEQTNFFNDILEPLFYEALATERTDNFYPRFDCRIPFLNGGLFEPLCGYDWVNTDILLDNAIFAGILEVFDLYNFTVREDEPLDKEMAVDPEMLGKVFENLIPDNERKGSGTYYTPREIVHYMCQESLINYLDVTLNIQHQPIEDQPQRSIFSEFTKVNLLTEYEDVYLEQVPRQDLAEFIYYGDVAQEHEATSVVKTCNENYTGEYQFKIPKNVRKCAAEIDAALASVKICDPAIGSGAFPVGMMNEIVRARSALNGYLGEGGRTSYEFKRHAIQESIYGVDIESSAVDIAKLRLWLSLVVDEDDFGTIKPLPNLEYKIMVGNSLLGITEDLFNHNKFVKLEQLKNSYFGETCPSEKQRLKAGIEKQVQEIVGSQKVFDFQIYFSEVFREKKGFDIVIGNPPYVVTKDEVLKKIFSESVFGRPNLYGYFIHKSIQDLLRPNGVAAFINPRTLLTDAYFSALRRFIIKYATVRALLNIVDRRKVFESVLQSCVVTFFQKTTELKTVEVKTIWTKAELSQVNYLTIEKSDFLFGPINDPIFIVANNATTYNIFRRIKDFKSFEQVGVVFTTGKVQWDSYKQFLISHHKEGAIGLIWAENIQRYFFALPTKHRADKQYINGSLKSGSPLSQTTIVVQRTTSVEQEFRIIATIITPSDFGAPIQAENHTSYLEKVPSDIDLKFILGLLNSKFFDFIFRYINSNTQVSAGELNSMPFPIIKPDEVSKISNLVDQLLSAKKINNKANTMAMEKEMDNLIYSLYNLNREEIEIVEKGIVQKLAILNNG